MNIKRILILFLTIIFIITLTFSIISMNNKMKNIQNKIAKEIVANILMDLNDNKIEKNTLNSIPIKLIYGIWIKKGKDSWYPIIYNNKLPETVFKPTTKIPSNMSNSLRNFIIKNNDYKFLFWINKYNIEYIFKYIILSILLNIIFYLIFLLIIELSIRDSKEYSFDENIEYPEYKKKDKEDIYINNEIDVLEYYKELWNKNFEVSDNFKNRFPFKKIFNLISITIKPKDYISKSIEFASQYFKWNNPKLYINQNNRFFDTSTNKELDTDKIIIPKNGSLTGDIYIPLFPYNTNIIYGYFCFNWNNSNDFYISDILYFLKFLFSDNAKFILLNYLNMENIINSIKDTVDKNDNSFIGMIEVDNKEKIKKELKPDEYNKLNELIIYNFKNSFSEYTINKISNLFYLISGKNSFNLKESIMKWFNDDNKQCYPISNEYGDIAVSFSCGIANKNKRNIHINILLTEAEENLKISILRGGNQII